MKRAAAVVVALCALLAAPVVRSGADFTAGSSDPANDFTAAADFNTVAVSLSNPGSPLRGSVSLGATASSDRGVDYVRFESSPAGAASWTAACTVSSSPYACSWDTTTVGDGARDVRAVAVDLAGYSRTDGVASRMVDNAGPSVSLADPGGWLQGSVTLDATASDPHSGLASVSIEYRAAGAPSWTQLCAAASCPLDTTALADGSYELRARATDAAGNAAASTALVRTVDNTAPTVSMSDPGLMHATVTLDSTTGDGAGTGVASVRYEYRLGAAPWNTACTAAGSCSWDTTAVGDGLYDLRAVAIDGTGLSTTSAPVAGRRVDNTAPNAVTLTDPGSPLQGTLGYVGAATDSGSGIASWTVQYRPAGGGSWADACTDTSLPYTCSWDSAGVADALYDLRAIGVDAAGNSLASAVLADRRIDNDGPTTTFTDPGTYLRGSPTLDATATDPAGVTSVAFRRRPASGGAWTTICTDNSSPYTCAFNTTTVADGSYDLEALSTDAVGHATSVVLTGRVVDNTAPDGLDVQALNGGPVAGQPETGDSIQFTFTEPISPASVLAGWDGSPVAVRAVFANAGSSDTLDILNGAGTARTNLMFGATSLSVGNPVTATTTFAATMSRSGSAITVTLGAMQSGNTRTDGTFTMSWRSSTAITDLAGNTGLGSTVTESGALDRDF